MFFHRYSLIVVGVATIVGSVHGQPPTLDVWPAAPPGERGEFPAETIKEQKGPVRPIKVIANVTKPTLTVFRPAKDKDTHAAVLVCPGGGYNILAWDLEGTEVAEWLNSLGVTAIVLKYRVPRRKDQPFHLAPLMDAQRAMSLVRSKAKDWDIDPKKIGILGFSAGGHLAAATATNFDKRAYEPIDDVDKVSSRPDFAVLIYPAYLVEKSKDTLNPEIRVTKESPPTFFAHANDDSVTPESSAVMYLGLKRAGVPAELHIYRSGGHGYGLRPNGNPVTSWPARCEEWLRGSGILPKS